MRGLDPRIQLSRYFNANKLDCRIKSGNDAVGMMGCVKTQMPGTRPGITQKYKNAAQSYCTLSATKRSSPSAFDTSSRTDFLPSFLS